MSYATVADTEALDTQYLITSPMIPRGDVTLLFGDGKVGKGRLTAWIVKQVTAAGGSVVVVLPEDHPQEQVKPRLIAAGLTPTEQSRVINLTRVEGGRFKLSADLTHDGSLPALRETILPKLAAEGHDVRLIVFDPLSAVVGFGSIQSNAGARRAIEPLQDLCADTGISGLVIAHTTKEGILQGSAGLSQAVRCSYRVMRDRNNPEIRVIRAEDTNNLPAQPDLSFVIEAHAGNARVVFLTAEMISERQSSWRARYTVSLKRNGVHCALGEYGSLREALAVNLQEVQRYGIKLQWRAVDGAYGYKIEMDGGDILGLVTASRGIISDTDMRGAI